MPPKSAKAKPSKASSDLSKAAKSIRDYDLLKPSEVIIKLVEDAAFSRIRHRALLDLLASQEFSTGAYLDRFRDLCERDLMPLASKFMMKDEDFNELFGEWKRSNEEYYANLFRREDPPA